MDPNPFEAVWNAFVWGVRLFFNVMKWTLRLNAALRQRCQGVYHRLGQEQERARQFDSAGRLRPGGGGQARIVRSEEKR